MKKQGTGRVCRRNEQEEAGFALKRTEKHEYSSKVIQAGFASIQRMKKQGIGRVCTETYRKTGIQL